MPRIVPVVLAALLVAALPASPVSAVEPPAPTCAPSCTVVGAGNAFAPRTVVVQEGATLTWITPADTTGHTANPSSFCFYEVWAPGGSGEATFHVMDGALYAEGRTSPLKPCWDAVAAGDGIFLLPYRCEFHPLMTGEIVVVAA